MLVFSVFLSPRVFASAMDVRNLPRPENFLTTLPSKRKLFPVFGVVFAFTLLFLSAVLLRNPSMLSPVSWFFPEPSSKISPAGSSAAAELQKSMGLLQQREEERIREKAHVGDFSGDVKNRSFSSFGGGSEKTHVSDFSEIEKNASEGIAGDNANDSASVGSIGGHPKCDIFNGGWVRDEEMPYYPVRSCPLIDRDFNCLENGRPDSDFLKWRWRPNDCDIPSLNGTDFLELLRGKRLVFVGDSLNRNMWESLVCILRHSVVNKSSVREISGRSDFKSKGDFSFIFEDHNCLVDYVASPFLVRQSSVNVGNNSEETLRLDLMDEVAETYQEADVLIFNTGHWWTHEKTSKGKYYYQEGDYVYPVLKVKEAYKRALTTWARWVDTNIDAKRTRVFFRGYSVSHFRGGRWNSGGKCDEESEPVSKDSNLQKYPSKMRILEPVLKDMRTHVVYMNISRLTAYRKDGHPSIYRHGHLSEQHSQDCSHWCLPGVPDTWNELLYASLVMDL